jgi:hypothetical protein
MTSNGNLESALAGGISKGIREGVGGALADGLVGLATIATLAAIVFNISPSTKPTSTEPDLDWNRGLKRGDPVAGYIVGSDVGYRIHPISGERAFHAGVDIAAPTGTPVFAVGLPGVERVRVDCGNEPGRAGIFATISSANPSNPSQTFLAMHLSVCNPGKYQPGESFGKVGSTGGSTGPHLHWESRPDGTKESVIPPEYWSLYQTLTGKLPPRSASNLSTGFDSAYEWTLAKEGGCSDHPANRGGRTYKGIIRSVAQRHGYSDPCTMPESTVRKIYEAEYWNPARCGEWQTAQMQLVCFDTAVNFGVGGWQMFSSQGRRRDGHRYPALPRDERAAAGAIAQWRLEFRDFRVREAPDQRVFLRGWRNRDRALMEKIK